MLARSPDEPDPAVAFAHAAARLASRAVLLAQRLDEQSPPDGVASGALVEASRAAEELERLTREGGDLHHAYACAARALDAASDALGSLESRARPWLHIVRRRPTVPAMGDDVST